MTERANVGDDTEIAKLASDAFDAPFDDMESTENIFSPILPLQDRRALARQQQLSVRDKEFISIRTLLTFENRNRPSVLRRFSHRDSECNEKMCNFLFYIQGHDGTRATEMRGRIASQRGKLFR